MGKERLYKKGVKIDDRHRIVIPAELLEELKINEGDEVSVYADFEENNYKKEGEK